MPITSRLGAVAANLVSWRSAWVTALYADPLGAGA
jgi:hypothetical protein|nr:hypothetical protein [Aeromicrobium sp.]